MNGIWGSNITRDALLQKITLLSIIGRTPEEPRRHKLVSVASTSRILTINQEAEIAGDLAFLSRRSLETQNVAAIGIEEDEDGHGMVVRVAVNGSMLKSVVDGLNRIGRILEGVAQNGDTEAHGIERLLQEVVELDYSRIAARLRLNKKYALSSSPLIRVQNALKKTRVNTEMLGRLEELVQLNRNLKVLSLHAPTQSARIAVATIIQSTYDLVYSHDLPSLLGQSIKSSDMIRAVDSLQKIGHYYRAVRRLVLSALRKNVRLLRNIRVIPFDIQLPPNVRKVTKRGESTALLRSLMLEIDRVKLLQRFQGSDSIAEDAIMRKFNEARLGLKVHAEIKLLLFYECHPQVRSPGLIAVSKSSCYLCNLFFRIHGAFQVSATFGTLNERWLLPDWIDPGPGTRLKECVREFDQALTLQLQQSAQRRSEPIESLVGLSASWSSLAQPTSHISPATKVDVELPMICTDSQSSLSQDPSDEDLDDAALMNATCARSIDVRVDPTTYSSIKIPIGALPFSQPISPNQKDVSISIGNFYLKIDLIEVCSGNLQISWRNETSVTPLRVLDLSEIPRDAELTIACSEDSPSLSFALQFTYNLALVLTFDWEVASNPRV